jgi:NAD(P)-dependent dehydrogenase (short-subunit alcohol dehydrogenase family)
VYETNVFGVVAVTNAMLPLLRRAPAARIVNVSSEVGSITSMTDPDGPMAADGLGALPVVEDRAEHGDRDVREGALRTPIKVNAANPGYCATDLNGHAGFRTPRQGAEVSVALATLPADGPAGVLWGHLWTTDGGGSWECCPGSPTSPPAGGARSHCPAMAGLVECLK